MTALLARWYLMLQLNRDWRQGQALFNALHDLHPKIADTLRGGPFDCFHQDKRIPGFLVQAQLLLSTVTVGEGS